MVRLVVFRVEFFLLLIISLLQGDDRAAETRTHLININISPDIKTSMSHWKFRNSEVNFDSKSRSSRLTLIGSGNCSPIGIIGHISEEAHSTSQHGRGWSRKNACLVGNKVFGKREISDVYETVDGDPQP